MKRSTNIGATRAVACGSPSCFEVATILVAIGGTETSLCPLHWSTLSRSTPDAIHAIEELDRPTCFKLGCVLGAVSVMHHLDHRPLPVCEQHLEDLSWVTPTPSELAGLEFDDD